MLAKLQARQLGHPSGTIGKLVLAPSWNKRNQALNDVARQRLALQPDDHVLEVGFGGGYLLNEIAAAVTNGLACGIDASEAMVAYCQRQYRLQIEAGRLSLCCATAEALPYPPARFDKACTVNSIFYWHDAPGAIAEIWRVLKDDGRLVTCFTCKESLQTKRFARQGLSLFEAVEVHAMMAAAGFVDITSDRLADPYREFWCMTAVKASRLDLSSEKSPI